MFRSLLAALAFSMVAVPAAQASTDGMFSFHLPSGKIEGQSAARHQGSGRSRSSKSTRNSRSDHSSGRAKDSSPSRADGPARSDSGGDAPARNDQPARADGPARSDSTDSRAPDNRGADDRSAADRSAADRSAQPAARDARPDAREMGNGRTADPAVHHLDSMRPAAAGGALGSNMRGGASAERRAPVNYRGTSHGYTAVSHRAQTARHAHNAAVAHAHQRAASRYVHGHARARAHVQAARWHSAYVRHHYGHAVWSRPHTWFAPWHPGYPHHWYHGVFVYAPAPWAPEPVGGGSAPEPKRAVDHVGDVSVGVRGGSYISGYTNGASFGDFGLGIAARYRAAEPVGLELQWNYHDDTWTQGSERIEQPLSASVELFAFPWSRVNPYALAGLTLTNRNVYDAIGEAHPVESDQAYWGPHGGVGLELNLSKKTSLNFDARWIGYVNKDPADLAHAGAVQLNSGLNFYF